MARISDLWRNRPLFKIIIDELARHGGAITDKDLLESIRNDYGFEVSKNELLSAILALELRGYITVNRVRKDYHIALSKHFITGRI